MIFYMIKCTGDIDLLENEVKENPGERVAFVKNEYF